MRVRVPQLWESGRYFRGRPIRGINRIPWEEKVKKTDPCNIEAGVASAPLLKDTNANLDAVCKQGRDRTLLGQRRARKS